MLRTEELDVGSDGHRDSEARPGESGHERPVGWKHGGKTLTVSRSNVHTDGLGKQVPSARATGPRAGRRPGRWAQCSLFGAGPPPTALGSGLCPQDPCSSRLAIPGPAGAPTPSAGAAGCRRGQTWECVPHGHP